jgi:hypothetical protein
MRNRTHRERTPGRIFHFMALSGGGGRRKIWDMREEKEGQMDGAGLGYGCG